jgi:hypothetical protein
MTTEGFLWVSMSSWRLRPQSESGTPLSDPFQHYLDEIVPEVNAHLQDKGLVSGWIVRTAEDTLTYIGVYTSQEAHDDLWRWARESDEVRSLFELYLEPIRHEAGPLMDVFRLGNRWSFGHPETGWNPGS